MGMGMVVSQRHLRLWRRGLESVSAPVLVLEVGRIRLGW